MWYMNSLIWNVQSQMWVQEKLISNSNKNTHLYTVHGYIKVITTAKYFNKYFLSPPKQGSRQKDMKLCMRKCRLRASCPARCRWESCRHSQPWALRRNSPIPQTRVLKSCKHLLDLWTKTQARNEPGEMKQALVECHTRPDLLLQLSFIILKIHVLRDELTFAA